MILLEKEEEFVDSGIPGLNEVLGGGFPRNSVILVSGQPGSGKTTFGLQFLNAGATYFNEPAIFISLEEKISQVIATSEKLGWDLRKLEGEGLLRLVDSVPSIESSGDSEERWKMEFSRAGLGSINEFSFPTIATIIRDISSEIGAKRVVLDSISPLVVAHPENRTRSGILDLVSFLSDLEVTAILTCDVHVRNQFSSRYEIGENLVQGVIRLDHNLVDSTFERTLGILKMRGCDHSNILHSFRIGKGGLSLETLYLVERPIMSSIKTYAPIPTEKKLETADLGIPLNKLLRPARGYSLLFSTEGKGIETAILKNSLTAFLERGAEVQIFCCDTSILMFFRIFPFLWEYLKQIKLVDLFTYLYYTGTDMKKRTTLLKEELVQELSHLGFPNLKNILERQILSIDSAPDIGPRSLFEQIDILIKETQKPDNAVVNLWYGLDGLIRHFKEEQKEELLKILKHRSTSGSFLDLTIVGLVNRSQYTSMLLAQIYDTFPFVVEVSKLGRPYNIRLEVVRSIGTPPNHEVIFSRKHMA